MSNLLTPVLVAGASFAATWPTDGVGASPLSLTVVFAAPLLLGPWGFVGALAGVLAANLARGLSLPSALLASAASTLPAAAGAVFLRLESPGAGARGSTVWAIGITLAVATSAAIVFALKESPLRYADVLRVLPGFVVAAAIPVATNRASRSDAVDARRGSFMATVLDNLPAVVFLKDARGRLTVVNRRFEAFLGRGREDILGRTDRELFPAEVAERFEREDREVLATGGVVEAEQTIPLDGKPRVYLVSKFPLLGPGGAPHSVGGVASDITEIRHLARAAQESEARLRDVLEHSTNLFYVHTTEHVFTYVSPQSRHFFGCDPEEAKVRWTEFVPDAASNRLAMESTERAIRTGTRQPAYEIEVRTRAGRALWVEVNEAPVVREGRTVAIVGALVDIDERRRAEHALRRALSLLEATLEASAEGILVVDLDGHIGHHNQRYVELWHVTAADLATGLHARVVQSTRSQLVDPDGFVARIRDVYARPEEDSFDILHFADGRIFERYSRPQRLDTEVVGRVWSFRDVTARRQAEEGLRASNETLRAIIGASPLAILTLDRGGRTQSWNPAAERTFGWTEAEVVGHVPLLVPDERLEEFRGLLAPLVREARPVSREVLRRRKDGATLNVHVHAAPVRAASGEVAGVVAILVDVTAGRLAEQEILRHRDHLAELVEERTRELSNTNRELETFCYTVSHDLRAPLRAIDGFSRILVEEAEDHLDEPARRHLARIRAAVGRMARLIDDLLQLSRVSRGELRRKEVNLTNLARTVVADLRAADPSRDVEVTIESALVANGDPTLLRSLLENLLGNAWKFSSGRARAHIALGARLQGGERVFFVRDDGAGFDMAYAARLFAPFERLHGAHEFEGTGVGLATVQRVVERHGGRVWPEAAVDKGATFYFTLAPSRVEAPRDSLDAP
ncbi:MAG: PAS domain S-box protein [Pseudomonadota bacterium]|nr:PAS domain S-box protein [Pseudomonadota bacterium]